MRLQRDTSIRRTTLIALTFLLCAGCTSEETSVPDASTLLDASTPVDASAPIDALTQDSATIDAMTDVDASPAMDAGESDAADVDAGGISVSCPSAPAPEGTCVSRCVIESSAFGATAARGVALSRDGTRAAISWSDSEVPLGIWILPLGGGPARMVPDSTDETPLNFVFAPDGLSLFAVYNDSVDQVSISTGARTLLIHSGGGAPPLGVSPDGDTLYYWHRSYALPAPSEGYASFESGELTGAPYETVEGGGSVDLMHSLAVSPSGEKLVYGYGDGAIVVLDAASHGVTSLASATTGWGNWVEYEDEAHILRTHQEIGESYAIERQTVADNAVAVLYTLASYLGFTEIDFANTTLLGLRSSTVRVLECAPP